MLISIKKKMQKIQEDTQFLILELTMILLELKIVLTNLRKL